MKCTKAEELMSLRLDGRLQDGDSKALSEHLASCESCRELSGRFERVEGLIGGWPAPAAPAMLKGRILAAFGPAQRQSRRRWVPVLHWGSAAAAAAVLAAAVVMTGPERGGPPDEVLPVAKEQITVEISPDLPPEVATLCRKAAPYAGETLMGAGRSAADSLADASEFLAARSAAVPRRLSGLSDCLMDGYVPMFMRGVERALRPFEAPEREAPPADPAEGALTGNEGLFGVAACVRALRPAPRCEADGCC